MDDSSINRRQFLLKAAKTLSCAAILGALPVTGFAGAGSNHVIDSFHSEPDELIRLLKTAMRRGGEFADVFLEQKVFRTFHFSNGKSLSTDRGTVEGLALRVMKKDHTAFAWVNSFQTRDARRAARRLSREFPTRTPVMDTRQYPQRPVTDAGAIIAKEKLENTSLDDIAGVLELLNRNAFKASNLLTDVSFDYHDEIRRIIVADSNGVYIADTQPLIDLRIRCKARRSGVESCFEHRISHRCGFDMLMNPSLEKRVIETAVRAVETLAVKPPDSFRMPVVFLPEASARLTESLFLHLVNTPGLMPSLRLPSGLSLTDNGRILNGRGSSHFDDEGVRTSETQLISQGRPVKQLNQRTHPDIPRRLLTGNSRRCSPEHAPMISPTNVYMEFSGSLTNNPAERMDDGLLVTAADLIPPTGDFKQVRLNITAGHRIKNGRRLHPVNNMMISGQIDEMLHRIENAGDTIDFTASDYGPAGCPIPVSYGAPALIFASLDISPITERSHS